ncbi:outer membrane channel protein TolC [Bowmanella yangjiangensis]|uniref:Outer membrane channel protein TolC n=1 Tax=Bowmanella yangjiangensis TaxID=2811230 RepID=A0ABS3CTV7_9ALTE|nr:outer membrane channel protein TolC [Bowmanella yangjiangensis]MBN7819571.1 outer membrane channel protein TolC [Bowmanella yangjiangensis]
MKKTLLSLLVGVSVTSQAFADDLYQVYQQALQKDPTILAAQARKDAAQSAVGISRASLLPQIDLSVGASLDRWESNGESNGATLSLRQSIYDHSYWKTLDRAELTATQANATYAQAQQALIVRVANAYFLVLQALDDLEFAQAEKRAIERQLEQTKQRFAVGLTAITDVHEAQSLFDNAVAKEITAQNTVEIRREGLREITGSYHSELNVLNTESFSTATPTPARVEDWLQIADERSLELTVAKLGVDIAKQNIEIAKSGHLPTVGFSASATSSESEVDGVTRCDRCNTASIGISVDIPIYSGGRVSSQTDQARHQFVASSEEREQVYRKVVRDVRSNFYDVSAYISRIKALEQAVVSAESALSATEAGFEVGTRTIVDVLNSTSNLYNARRNLSIARYEYIVANLELKQAAGTLVDQDVLDINRGLKAAK